MGHESDIYALTIDEDMRGEVRSFDQAASRGGDLTIFHYALPSAMSGAFRDLPRHARAAIPQHHAGPASSPTTTRRCSGSRPSAVTT
jgi:hypothetical protein